MEIILGKYAGFCRGVSLALSEIEKNMAQTKLCTYGSIIHNKAVTDKLESAGVRIIDELSQAEGATVVIRTHGVPPAVYETLEQQGVPYMDCTCRDVKRIHAIAEETMAQGRQLIIVGNAQHPEVVGINGFAGDKAIIIGEPETVDSLSFPSNQAYTLVVQTTYIQEKFNHILEKLKAKPIELTVHNTICPAMQNRQQEAEALSHKVDAMVVIGDKNSSNTVKLFEICKNNCRKTYLIESVEDLQLKLFHNNDKIGIVAGASTPPDIIKEAFLTMSELDNNMQGLSQQENNSPAEPLSQNAGQAEDNAPAAQNQTFEEMLDQSFVTLRTGDVVKGTVIRVTNGEVSVNLGYKSDGLIPRGEFSEDPAVDPAQCLQPGDDIDVFVVRVNDGDGNVLLSKKKIDAKKGFDEVEAAFNNKTPIEGKVTEVVKGGLVVNVKGVRVFVPSSQVSNRYVEDLQPFKGQNMTLEILEFEKGKRRIVGGRRALATKEQDVAKERVFNTIEPGQDIEGVVSRISPFGAFVDLGGVDGLIHISQMSWGRVKKVSDVLAEGAKVTVRVLEVDKERGRISLSLKDTGGNPWDSVTEKYHVGDIVEGKVVRMTTFGAFVELEEGVDGLVHISQIANKHVAKPEDELQIGQVIQVKVMDVQKENSRISLSKREADGVEEVAEDVAPEEMGADEAAE